MPSAVVACAVDNLPFVYKNIYPSIYYEDSLLTSIGLPRPARINIHTYHLD
jgi:hypothetical protein